MNTLTPPKTFEPQYQVQIEDYEQHGPVRLGLTTSHLWRSDSRHLLFFLSRYKFVSKMLAGTSTVLEVGCGDGFGSKLVSDTCGHVTGTDIDAAFIDDARNRENFDSKREFHTHDYLKGPWATKHDALYSLDVIEHIHPRDEDAFILNATKSLNQDGVAIFGTPSLESQIYASKWSKAGHINCKSADDWKVTFQKYYKQVFIFSMNDEVVHTGFNKMAHYLFLMCVGPKAAK